MSHQQHCVSSDYPNTMVYPKEKLEFSDQSMVYPGSALYISPIVGTHPLPQDACYYYDHHQVAMQYAQKSSSPESTMTLIQEPPMLVTSSSSTTTASSSSADFLHEAFAKASSIPESFYPEFLQYSKETYEQPSRKKQKRLDDQVEESKNDMNEAENNEEDGDNSGLTSTELRRQIHIQSEQKRRAQIKDGFEELRSELPTCLNKKMSKVALLHRTVQHIQHLKETQVSILSELEKLVHENEQLRKFQESVLQKQALESMYTMTNM
ncbi:HLH-domain-containing protein [Backusella circina FSU 941]|nr:HLH-domain-containing protein [Backusella circina FSU 941]